MFHLAIALLGTAAMVEIATSVLLLTKKIGANPHAVIGTFSGIAFAVTGLILYLI